MPNNLVLTEANRYIDAGFATAAYVAPTSPIRVALLTANGTNTAAGTEVTGGSYARQTITMGAAASGSASNSNTINFTGLPAATVTGIDIYDSNGTPRRIWTGPLTASKTVGAGDTLSFSASSIVASLA
ncbi:phage tail fiber protein [Catenuloplanes indicus]|uniref:Imidazolonepropionase-like amidohydrolase n=1 Tax=Catenuloplanes indicus TaxID=137267 RepID=A0AAE3W8T0_9ACTN|nr:hypothetical protein [Catenuloplanes indicus]MDQ0371606.1 imidazolonepropionase-like amidohydrolase [Catenuloplanes indicus]MDQ0371619.1 imidazolonepropionase-like amidohydrolase [Catenuloplanes indicus]